ncbi:hypothetical protein F5887DRAFT_1134767 [Amanita rubescens]|nr:hypothetical protein F5887DRAFT_1134767 [Amanita rubescens]
MDVNIDVPEGYVALVLLREENTNSAFYLQIPLDIINGLCLRSLKYLHFLGWCILGAEGVLALEFDGDEINTDRDIVDQQIYYYVLDDVLDPARVIDLEVIKARTNVPSETTATRDDFRTRLLERDVCCVWSGTNYGAAIHIIPFKQGPDWLRLIITNRPKYRESVAALNDINDIRNGVFANGTIHQGFDERSAAILKTPNHILRTEDVPPCPDRIFTSPDVSYPTRNRYTLQWLESQDAATMHFFPNNSDAAFRNLPRERKPSALLLHYNYGAAAVKNWGRGKDVLQRLANPPRPQVPVPVPAGPPRVIHDRAATVGKLQAARIRGGGGAGAGAGAGAGVMESDGQGIWDEDDIMLFNWANTRAAKNRHLKKAGEDSRRIEQWRGGVPQGLA